MSVSAIQNPNMEKIERFFNESGYKELTLRTARYNTKIRRDRIYRQPYIDSQTGVAQRHCHLFLDEKSRMPGTLHGQIYTYPRRKWRAENRSYLASTAFMNPPRVDHDEHTITTVENPAVLGSAIVGDDQATMMDQEHWQFYEENEFEEMEGEDFESEEDLEDFTYSKKGNRRRPILGMRRGKGRSRPRRPLVMKPPTPKMPQQKVIKKVEDDPEHKPYICELCGMRYKTRPGLTYHYSHTHKDDENKDKIVIPPPSQLKMMDPTLNPGMNPPPFSMQNPPLIMQPPLLQRPQQQMSPKPPMIPSSVMNPSIGKPDSPKVDSIPPQRPQPTPEVYKEIAIEKSTPVERPSQESVPIPIKKSVNPSPYCDFCLGDSKENKKTRIPEQLVSCADCGRSGHPTCLQFTDNMMKSVLHYRWQCIECKTCTLCGTSENDDQLLFCDDCDRGYHLYCLTPPLHEPPEGEWSCQLCIKQFHSKK